MGEQLGVDSHTILSERVQTVWDLDERQRGIFVRVNEVGHRCWAAKHVHIHGRRREKSHYDEIFADSGLFGSLLILKSAPSTLHTPP
jgi:hypothetical protein